MSDGNNDNDNDNESVTNNNRLVDKGQWHT